MSFMDVKAPSSVPNMLSNPRVSSMRKKSTDHKGAMGNWLMASVKAMNASPVPEPDCSRGNNLIKICHEFCVINS